MLVHALLCYALPARSAPAAASATLGHAHPPSSTVKTGPSANDGSQQPTVASNLSKEIDALSLHVPIPTLLHIYVLPFLFLYPLAIYIYAMRYDDYLGDQANTFIGCVALFGSHALTWLATKWSMAFKAKVTSLRVGHSAVAWRGVCLTKARKTR